MLLLVILFTISKIVFSSYMFALKRDTEERKYPQ